MDGEPEEVEPTLAEDLDQRLRLNNFRPEPSSQPVMSEPGPIANQPSETKRPVKAPETNQIQYTLKTTTKNGDDDSEDDSDFDSDFDDDDYDDPALEAFRQRRLAELKRAQMKDVENKAKGHGEYRTISQDEFLPECTGSEFVAVHFFHKDFESCKIMDHHLKTIAACHLSCKFVRIDAEKSPFFIGKLNVKTLPTLIIFKDGKTIDRLTGFEGLSDTKHPNEFPTSRLGRWLEKTKAIEYEGPDSDDEEVPTSNNRSRRGMLSSRFQAYGEDI